MTRVKLIVVLILAAVAAVIAFQNTEVVETKMLFATVIMPRAFLLFITVGLGFVMGLLVSIMVTKKRESKG